MASNGRYLPKECRITRNENQAIKRTRFPIRFANPEHPIYQRLRDKLNLGQLISGCQAEFDQLVVIRDWLRGKWAHGWDGTRLLTNALEILEEVEQGKEFHCWYFTMVYCACLSALGFQARPIAIGKANTDFIPRDEMNISHVTAEVWSNEFGKWVVMDTDANCHYEQEGIPLSAYEVRRAWLQGQKGKVKRISGKTPAAVTTRTAIFSDAVKKELFDNFFRYDIVDYYHYLRFLLRMDLSEAQEDELGHLACYATSLAFGQTGMPAVQWVDCYSPPQIYIENWPIPKGLEFTSCLDDIYWTLNQAEIGLRCLQEPAPRRPPVLRVSLTTVTPSFSHFEAQLNGSSWEHRPAQFDWLLREGENLIEARPVNTCGVKGIVSSIAVRYMP